jgi:hypothetical protein
MDLFKDGSWVVENFNDLPVQVELNGQTLSIEGRGWTYHWERQGELDKPTV